MSFSNLNAKTISLADEAPIKVYIADTLFLRTRGLLFRKKLEIGEGLWIKKCNAIHTCFMTYCIDVVFLDEEMRVKKLVKNVKPWRNAMCLTAKSVIELPSHSEGLVDLSVGSRLIEI